MGEKYREKAAAVSCECIAEGIYSLYLQTEKIARACRPGQFVSVYSADKSRLLPRPISVCETDPEKGILRLVFRIAGSGTEEFSRLKSGDRRDITGPLGNGFDLKRLQGKRVLAVGGGIGIPPMLKLAGELDSCTAVLGYRSELFLKDDFERVCPVLTATEDGSSGTKGTVIDAIQENGLEGDVICACGPAPMLRALKSYAQEHGMECWLSMEEKMACGIGACLSCVCRSTEPDEHSRVKNKRICTEGPVFEASEIVL